MTDLDALKIDRSGPRRRRRRAGVGKWIALAVVAGLIWLFRAPLLERLDRLRLPHVSVLRVRETGALAASAITGTAANGYVVAAVRAALSADTPGRIVEMNVSEGSVVKRGDVVARLYSEEYEADLERAEADLAVARQGVQRAEAERDAVQAQLERLQADERAAEAELEAATASAHLAELELIRAQRLVDAAVQSQRALDQALAERDRSGAAVAAAQGRLVAARAAAAQLEAQVAASAAAVGEATARVPVAEALRARARATLDKTFVRAPFDGVVVLKDAEVGEVVSPNAVGAQSRGSVVTMVDFGSLEVQVEVPETSLQAVSVGAPVRVFLDAYPEAPYAGRVQRIWPTANRQKATVEVRVGFEQPDQRLRPEMGVRAVFLDPDAGAGEAPEPGILIPLSSLVPAEDGRGVFVLERGRIHLRALELGEERGTRVLVRSGLEVDEQVVLDPPAGLEDGDRVIAAE